MWMNSAIDVTTTKIFLGTIIVINHTCRGIYEHYSSGFLEHVLETLLTKMNFEIP